MVNKFANNNFGVDKKPDQKVLNNLINSTNFEVENNMYAHKRQVEPGDHRRKLKMSTIRKLNQ